MAACGLDPGRRDSLLMSNNVSEEAYSGLNVVLHLLKFATRLLYWVNEQNRDTEQPFQLRVGE